MADKKISALTETTAPASGDMIPIVQGGVTKRVDALNIGKAITAVGALNAGSITSGFGAIDIGADALTAGAGSFSTLAASGAANFGTQTLAAGNTAVTGTISATEIISANKGITFPASQVASTDANTLDDYEEGTYTATLTCGTSGTITVNTAGDQVAYTKTGRVVHIQGFIYTSAISSPLGSLILNLPFTIASLADYAERSAGSVIADDIEVAAGTLLICVLDGATVQIVRVSTTGVISDDMANKVKAGTGLYIGFSYIAA